MPLYGPYEQMSGGPCLKFRSDYVHVFHTGLNYLRVSEEMEQELTNIDFPGWQESSLSRSVAFGGVNPSIWEAEAG